MNLAGDSFERGLLAALELACAKASRIAEAGEMPEHEVGKLVREGGYLFESGDSEIDWEALSAEWLHPSTELADLLSAVADQLEKGSLVETLLRGENETLVAEEFDETTAHEIGFYVLIPVLKCYGMKRPDWGWNLDLARELISEWKAELTSQAQGCFRSISPLRYFDGPGDPIRIDDQLVLRPFTDRDREDLWHDYRQMRGQTLSASALDRWSHVVDYRWERPAEHPLGHEIGVTAVEDLVRALRLFHPGLVQRTMVWTRHDPPIEAFSSPFQKAFFHGPETDYEDDAIWDIGDEMFDPERVVRTRIDAGDGGAIGELLRRMQEERGDRRLALALRRFDSSYSRHEDEDSLIDLWVAFEALVLPDGKSELSYRAAMRIAALVGDESAGRREAFQLARRSYKCRSQVVHGEATPESLSAVVTETRELARKVLRAWLLDPPQGGIEEIDGLLF